MLSIIFKLVTGCSTALFVLMLSGTTFAASVTYTYDSLNRVVGVDYGCASEAYAYDPAGNRTSVVVDVPDSDSDGITDCFDVCLYDWDNDIDGDGLCGDVDNCPSDSNNDQTDTDNDGIGDVCDPDDDNDGLTDDEELIYGTDPLNPDSDYDGYSDGDEVAQGTDPLCERSTPGNNYSVRDDLAGTFIDISATGTDSGIYANDDGVELPIGFDFNFYGQTFNSVWVSSNGYLTFDPTNVSDYSNDQIPNTTTPNSIIAAFWDDLDLSNAGSILYQTTGIAPNRQFIVMYNQVPHISDSGSSFTFEIVLLEADNSITIIYSALQNGSGLYADGSNATVGIEDSSGTAGTEYSYNGSNLLYNGLTVRFTLTSVTGTCADTDVDGVYDDIDNCPETFNPDQIDSDGDLVGDVCDNCVEVVNPDQRDTNSDEDDNTFLDGIQHYGNICDGDFDNNGIVEIRDFILWRPFAGQQTNPTNEDMDMNGNGAIWTDDFIIWRGLYGKVPGPGIGD